MENASSLPMGNVNKLTKTLLLGGLSIGYFMVILDMTVVSVALPAIQADLGGGIVGLGWVVNAYTIVYASLLLSMGAFADKLGAKRIYLGGLAVFLAASVISAAAPSLGTLIGMRALLGVGGAALTPATLTLIAHLFPVPAERARVLGVWAAVTGMAMAAGPAIGGIMVDSLGWRSIFLMNVPLAAIGIMITWRLVGETHRNPRQSYDAGGQIAAVAAIVALSFALMEGASFGWQSPVILASFGLAIASASAFLIVEGKGSSPLLPLRIFRNATTTAGMATGFAINMGFSGILFLLPLFYQQTLGWSARMTGLALLPMMIPMAFNPMITGRIVGRIGARLPTTLGFGLGASGAVLLAAVNTQSSYLVAFFGLLMVGFGVSFVLPALMAAVMASVPKEQTGAASGALNASRQLGATLGVAILGAMMSGSADMRLPALITVAIWLAGCLLSYAYMGRSR